MTTPQSKTNTTLAMPIERAAQLRKLAQDLGGISMSAALGQLFEAARKTGLIKSLALPGVDVAVAVHTLADGTVILIRFDGGGHVPFTLDGARALAETVRLFAIGQNDRPFIADQGHNFSVQRKGSGVRVEIDVTKATAVKVLNLDLAAELADLIYYAIDEQKVKTEKAELSASPLMASLGS